MQFDVIIGNPPYQLGDGGDTARAQRRFINCSWRRRLSSIRDMRCSLRRRAGWQVARDSINTASECLPTSGCGSIVDYPKLYEGFPGVKIRGGISYFLWDREHNGPLRGADKIGDGQPTGPAVARQLDAYDILVRRNEAVPILEKIKARGERHA